MFRTRLKTPIIGLAISSIMMLMLALSTSGPAFADSCVVGGGGCSITVSGAGSVTSSVGTITPTGTSLDGTDKTLSIPRPITVTDATGTGDGWSLSLAMTTVTTGSHPLGSTVNIAMIGGCYAGSTCTLPNGDTTASPTTETITPSTASLTTANSSPTPVLLTDTAANGGDYYGMGKMTLTATLTDPLPAGSTYAGPTLPPSP